LALRKAGYWTVTRNQSGAEGTTGDEMSIANRSLPERARRVLAPVLSHKADFDIVKALGSVITTSDGRIPPLNVSMDDLDRGIDTIEQALQKIDK
jgi:4-aminobutyrate aminotransferase-like enzyme